MTYEGPGRIFTRGKTLWISFYVNGQEQRESVAKLTGKAPAQIVEADAERCLRRRLKEVARGHFVPFKQARLRVADLLRDYDAHLEVQGAKALRSLRAQLAHVRKGLGRLQAIQLTGSDVKRFVLAQRASGAAAASIRARVACLRAALHLAHRNRRLPVVPPLPAVRVSNARTGFFEPAEFSAIAVHLPEPVADIAAFAYLTGWRSGEILALTWEQVDRQAALIRLATSKTGEGRVLPLVGELAALLERRWAKRVLGSPWVFHRRGKPVRWFRGTWLAACKAAGLPTKRFHDFRRTAARDLIAAGHDYKSAMSVTGHRTMSTFLRYQIVDTRQTASALAGLQAHRQAKRTHGQGTDNPGRVGREGLR